MNVNTERLVLVPVSHDFDADIFKYFDSDVTTYMTPTASQTLEKTQAVVQGFADNFALGEEFVFAITLKDNGEFLGLCGLHNLSNVAPELGIWTKPAVHGNHYGREAIGGLIGLARANGYTRLIYPVDTRNIASKKIPLFYGGELIKQVEKCKSHDGRDLLIETYEILL